MYHVTTAGSRKYGLSSRPKRVYRKCGQQNPVRFLSAVHGHLVVVKTCFLSFFFLFFFFFFCVCVCVCFVLFSTAHAAHVHGKSKSSLEQQQQQQQQQQTEYYPYNVLLRPDSVFRNPKLILNTMKWIFL